jgi:hypothetical protein
MIALWGLAQINAQFHLIRAEIHRCRQTPETAHSPVRYRCGHPALRRRRSPISTVLRAVRWAGALLVFGDFTLDFVRGSDEQAN